MSGQLIVIDAAQIAAASDVLTLDSARHAAIEMNDSPSGAAQSLVSLWQRNLTALRAERYFGFGRLSDSAIAILTDALPAGSA